MDVTNLSINQHEANVYVDNLQLFENKQIQPTGRLLVDSASLAFIYILDIADEFVYLSFPNSLWNELKTILAKDFPLFLYINTECRVPLLQFKEEIEYLVANIEGNSNYGEKLVQAVSNVFID